MAETSPAVQRANDFLKFINASPTPYHAVKNAKDLLEKAGFKYIKERDPWSSSLKPGGKYYLTRNSSSLVAFAIGRKWRPGNPVSMVAAHTDSCCLRVKPVSKRQSDGFLQVGVETYGGGIWHTWFDRDLSVAGRIMVKGANGEVTQKLVKVDRPICRIPTLAIHFGKEDGFSPNTETQLFPITGMVAAELNRQTKAGKKVVQDDKEADSTGLVTPLKALMERHHPYIVEVVAEEAGVEPESIVDFEIILYDTQKSCLGGLNDELIFSARLDDLMMSFCAIEGLIKSVSSSSALDADSTIRLAGIFDHEEVGSVSQQGANSNFLPAVLRRLSVLPSAGEDVSSDASYDKLSPENDTSTAFEQSMASSFLISADMGHSVNPNYPAKYEPEHRPEMNKGVVIKINANQRYTTNAPGVILIQQIAERAKEGTHPYADRGRKGVPLQFFIVRNDTSCGSTIGPMSAAKLGVRTLDLGNPQLSMHSIRETGGAYDVEHAINLFDSFYENFGEVNAKIEVD